jgi:cyclophilin family peptidyl-prolyl cis-trans isomerase
MVQYIKKKIFYINLNRLDKRSIAFGKVVNGFDLLK